MSLMWSDGTGVDIGFSSKRLAPRKQRLSLLQLGKSMFAPGGCRVVAASGDGRVIAQAFGRTADVIGLSDEERALLFGGGRELSRGILALETIGVALDLYPVAAAAWFRNPCGEEPFKNRSPLQLIAADGRLGVEITLLYLRAQRRRSGAHIESKASARHLS